jgi:hypothetical protein
MAVYRDTLAGLVDDAEARTGRVYDRYADGTVGRDGFVAATTATLLAAEDRAAAVSDLALADHLQVPALGLVVAAADRAATGKAVATLTVRLTETPNPRARALRLARGRTTGAAGKYFDIGLATHPKVAGYRRGLSSLPCQLCRWLYRGGFVYPAGQPMYRHPGCMCVPLPVTR